MPSIKSTALSDALDGASGEAEVSALARVLAALNEETLIQVDRTGPAKVLAWVKEHKAALESMSFAEVSRALDLMNVRSHYYCAID